MSATVEPHREQMIKWCSAVTGDHITVHVMIGPDEERAVLAGVLTFDPGAWCLLFDSLESTPGMVFAHDPVEIIAACEALPMAQLMICRQRWGVLDPCTGHTGVTRVHAIPDSPADHEPDPIPMPADYWGGRCDFCCAPHPDWVLPARDFLIPTPRRPTSMGDWTACRECAVPIAADNWPALVDRVMEVEGERYGPGFMALRHGTLMDVYAALRANITGPIRQIRPSDIKRSRPARGDEQAN